MLDVIPSRLTGGADRWGFVGSPAFSSCWRSALAAYGAYAPATVEKWSPAAGTYAWQLHDLLPASVVDRKPGRRSGGRARRRLVPRRRRRGSGRRRPRPRARTCPGGSTRSARSSRSPPSRCARVSTRPSIRCWSPTAPRSRPATFSFKLDARQADAQLKGAQAQLAKDQAQLEQTKRDVARYTDLVARAATPVLNLDNAKTAVATNRGGDPRRSGGDRQSQGSARLVYDHGADFGPRRHRRHQGRQYRQDGRQQRGRRFCDDQPDFADLCLLLGDADAAAGDPRSDGRTGAKVVATPQGSKKSVGRASSR